MEAFIGKLCGEELEVFVEFTAVDALEVEEKGVKMGVGGEGGTNHWVIRLVRVPVRSQCPKLLLCRSGSNGDLGILDNKLGGSI